MAQPTFKWMKGPAKYKNAAPWTAIKVQNEDVEMLTGLGFIETTPPEGYIEDPIFTEPVPLGGRLQRLDAVRKRTKRPRKPRG